MAFTLKPREHVGEGLARVAAKTLKRTIVDVSDRPMADAIQAARKSTKKVRAILALVEHNVRHTGQIEKRLRNIGRSLSPLRDAHAIVETFNRIAQRAPADLREDFRIVSDEMKKRAERLDRAAMKDDLLGETRAALKHARRKLRRVRLGRVTLGDARDGVKRAYRRGRRALATALDTRATSDAHRLRKRTKTLWYHLRVLANHVHATEAIEAAGRLEELLGEDHNVAVLESEILRTCRALSVGQRRNIRRVFHQYQQAVRGEAFALGRRFFAAPAKAFVKRLETASGNRRTAPRQKAA